MALQFLTRTIKCGDLHSTLHVIPGDLQVQRTFYWGLLGVSEIVGGTAWDTVETTVWLTHADFDEDGSGVGVDNLTDYMRTLRSWRGDHGRVREIPPISAQASPAQVFKNCTFENFEPIALPGQDRPTPFLDSTQSTPTWMQAGILRWTMLRDDP